MIAWTDGRLGRCGRDGGDRSSSSAAACAAPLGSRDALGFVALGRGDVSRARPCSAIRWPSAARAARSRCILPALWGLAETALVAGEPAVAVDHCEEALDGRRRRHERGLLVPFVVTGVRAHLAAQRPDEAERWAEAHRVGARRLGGPADVAQQHAAGLLSLAAGSSVAARGAFESAIDGWEAIGRIWESTWARLDLVAALVRANRHVDAAPVLREARDVAERLGSTPLLRRADELGSIVRSRGTMDEPWRPLTVREFEVARLVAEGMTNGEIAEALGLSPKTVSAHLEHILAKLGAMRRAEVAAWVTTIRPPTVAASAIAEPGGHRARPLGRSRSADRPRARAGHGNAASRPEEQSATRRDDWLPRSASGLDLDGQLVDLGGRVAGALVDAHHGLLRRSGREAEHLARSRGRARHARSGRPRPSRSPGLGRAPRAAARR